MADVTFLLPSGTRVRSGTQRALVLISEWTDPDTGKVIARVERRSDSEAVLRAVLFRRRSKVNTRWFIGVQATGKARLV